MRGTITMPMTDKNKNAKEKPLVFYSVIYRKYDSPSELHGKLYHARYAYLVEDAYGRRVIDDVCDGVEARWVYNISKKGLKWKATKGGKVVQRAIPETTGYGVVTIGSDDRIVSNTVFDDQHQWVHNYYYLDDNMLNPHIIIEPIEQENAMNFLVYDKEYRKYSKKKLYACPIELGSAVQSIVNNELGEPEICAATSQGDFCYCSRTERNRRLSLAQKIRLEEDGTIPTWEGPNMDGIMPTEPDFDLNIDLSKYKFHFTPEQMGVEPLYDMPNGFDLEQDEPKVQTDLDEKKNNNQPFVNFEDLLHTDLSDSELMELDKSQEEIQTDSQKELPEMQCKTTDLKETLPSGQPYHSSTYFANRELYHVQSAKQSCEHNTDIESAQTEKQVNRMIEQVDQMIEAESGKQLKADESMAQPRKAAQVFTVAEENRKPSSSRYTVAVQKANGKTFCTKEVLRNTVAEREPNAVKSISAAKRIVVSEEESYLYFGKLIDGLRQGRGRTEMENGYTVYEGNYRHDKRDGFGAYYYKSGQICYIGDWKDNKRDGVGVSYTPHGETIHVGKWSEDTPVGTGAIFDSDGNLSFAGRIEHGLRQGAGVSYHADDGAIFVGKWKDNIPTGKGSEFDRDGNLIYTGMWKDGKRHGSGTEYDKEGNVIFTGEWENDQYLDGVLYQKIEQPYEQDTGIDF